MKRVFLVCTVLLLFPCVTIAGSIPDTGQTKCYENTQQITCPHPGEPFYGQDAQYSCYPQLYTKLDDNGNTLPDTATEWMMVRDNVTGLIWEVKTDNDNIKNYENPNDSDNRYIRYDSNPDTNGGYPGTPGDGIGTFDTEQHFINVLNATQFGGYSDWRLPTIKEISFLRNMDKYDPTINNNYFPNTKSMDQSILEYEVLYYWSSTAAISEPRTAWLISFLDSHVSSEYKESSDPMGYNGYVRAVRGGQSSNNFVDNEDGTVTDEDTGLMWQKTTVNNYTWQEALTYCEDLSLAGYDDWRLPNVNELQSIVDYSNNGPAINTDYFPDPLPIYWVATSIAGMRGFTLVVTYTHEHSVIPLPKLFEPLGVRAVRELHCSSSDTSTTTTVANITTTITTTTSLPNGSTTTTTICPFTAIYGTDSEETQLLRSIRDNVLSQTHEGRELIKLYYQWSPFIVRAMEADENFKEDIKDLVDEIMGMVE